MLKLFKDIYKFIKNAVKDFGNNKVAPGEIFTKDTKRESVVGNNIEGISKTISIAKSSILMLSKKPKF